MTTAGEIHSRSPEETLRAGKEFAGTLCPGDRVIISGPLGSGKTHFIKGICSRFEIHDQVNSPSFIIVNEYEGSMEGKIVKINHFDLYRIKSPSELDEIGLESYFTGDSITIAEWGEIAGERFPETVNVKMSYGEHESERIISIERKKNPPH